MKPDTCGGLDSSERETLAAILEGHRSFYGLLSRLFYAPLAQTDLDGLASMDVPAQPATEAGSSPDALLAEGLGLMTGCLACGSPTLRRDLNVDYTSAFYGIAQYEQRFATPYESVFRSVDRELYGEQRSEVFAAFKQSRLKLKEGIDLPEDHLSFELQYIAILSQRAADAIADGSDAEARSTVEAISSFIDEHILSWIDDLAGVANNILELDFYRGALMAAKGFLQLARIELDEMEKALG